MTPRVRALVTMVAGVFSGVASAADSCDRATNIVGNCWTVHGRISITNGTPGVRIWPVGTMRLLAVAGPEDNPFMPSDIFSKLTVRNEAFGNFEVCPLTAERAHEMQFVCVRSVSKLLVRDR